MTQLTFDIPIAHTSDPSTSHEAAANITASGKLSRHEGIVLGLVREYPGRTAVELWTLALPEEQDDLSEMQRVRQRLSGLLHAGRVKQGEARKCRVRYTRMVTWRVV